MKIDETIANIEKQIERLTKQRDGLIALRGRLPEDVDVPITSNSWMDYLVVGSFENKTMKTLERKFAEELTQKLSDNGAILNKQDTRNIERAFGRFFKERFSYMVQDTDQRATAAARQIESELISDKSETIGRDIARIICEHF